MKKLEIRDLNKELIGQQVSIIGVIEWKEKKTEDGSLYLKVMLDDGTGRVYTTIFPQSPWVQKLLNIPQLTRVALVGTVSKIATSQYTANIIDSIKSIDVVNVNRNGNIDIGKVQQALRNEYKKISDQGLRKLVVNCMKNVPTLFEAPFSENHYAYQGGLALYMLRCLQLVETMAGTLTNNEYIVDMKMDIQYDMDVLRTGIFLHRIGKTAVYAFDENGIVYKTLSGQMNGDVLETIQIVAREMGKVTLVPEKKMLLEHLIASSKKLQIWGALTEPKTKESHLLHHIEQLVLNHSQFESLSINASENGELIKGAFNKRYYVSGQQ